MLMMTGHSYRWLVLLLAGLGLAADQWSKYGVFRWLYEHPTLYQADRLQGEWDFWPGVMRLHTQFRPELDEGTGFVARLRQANGGLLPHVNNGALFGLRLGRFFGNPGDIGWRSWDNALFALVSVLAAVAIGYWATRPSTATDGVLCAALGLILAGTLGNLYDRLVFGGVRDFLYFYWIEWPVFNVADCCLVVGAGLLMWQAMFPPQKPAASEPTSAPT
jgi:lipoprotein signal peptidase